MLAAISKLIRQKKTHFTVVVHPSIRTQGFDAWKNALATFPKHGRWFSLK